MINVFIDTNIFLNFYHFSNEDLDNLSDLLKLIEVEKVNLYVTGQVIDEYNRNRETKIHDAIKRLNSNDIKSELPQMCLDYPEVKDLKNAERIFKEKKKLLISKVSADIASKSLKADKVIKQLFGKAKLIPITETIHKIAKKRIERGNPPGKNGSLGDAINWESLLANFHGFEDFHFVSGDFDYSSPINENELLDFLKDEWVRIIGPNIFYHRTFYQFLKVTFPDIKLITEEIKNSKIEAFRLSPSFDAARARLAELYKINDFTDDQIGKIIEASISNTQIYWAHEYSPELIGKVLEKIVETHVIKVPYDTYQVFCEKFGIEEPF